MRCDAPLHNHQPIGRASRNALLRCNLYGKLTDANGGRVRNQRVPSSVLKLARQPQRRSAPLVAFVWLKRTTRRRCTQFRQPPLVKIGSACRCSASMPL